MSSKISGTENRGTGAVGVGRPVGKVRDVTSEPKTAEQQSSDVHITGTARQLVELEQVVKDMPAVDEAKVAALSAAIERGTYKVSADKVADNFMQIEQALAPLNGKGKVWKSVACREAHRPVLWRCRRWLRQLANASRSRACAAGGQRCPGPSRS